MKQNNVYIEIKITGIQSGVVVRGKHSPLVHPATEVDAVALSIRLVAAGSRRRRFAAVLAAVDDVFAAHVDSFKASAGVELLDHVKHVFLAQAPLVELNELVDGARVDKASRGDGADVLDVILRVGSGQVAQRLKLGVPAKRVKSHARGRRSTARPVIG